MNSNWFEMEQVVRYRHDDLLKVAADLRRAEQARHARADTRAPRTPIVLLGPEVKLTLAVRLGKALVVVGKRLQGTSA